MAQPPAPLDGTMGALFIGMMVSNTLYGISIVQAYYYYRHQNDNRMILSLVAAVLICDTVNQALITHSMYIYLITNFGNVEELGKIVPTIAIENIFNAFTAALVQSFLTYRVWRLSNGSIFLTGLIASFVLAGLVSTLVFTAKELRYTLLIELTSLKPLSLTINILAAIGDLLIAVVLCFVLHRSRTGFQRSEAMINKLILFAVNTGLLTSIFALSSFISYMAAPNTFIYVAFYFCIGRLYANSLLANLNARKMIQKGSENLTSGKLGVSFHDMHKVSTSQNRGATNISIKIDTTKEFVTDDKNEITLTASSNMIPGFEKHERV